MPGWRQGPALGSTRQKTIFCLPLGKTLPGLPGFLELCTFPGTTKLPASHQGSSSTLGPATSTEYLLSTPNLHFLAP